VDTGAKHLNANANHEPIFATRGASYLPESDLKLYYLLALRSPCCGGSSEALLQPADNVMV